MSKYPNLDNQEQKKLVANTIAPLLAKRSDWTQANDCPTALSHNHIEFHHKSGVHLSSEYPFHVCVSLSRKLLPRSLFLYGFHSRAVFDKSEGADWELEFASFACETLTRWHHESAANSIVEAVQKG